MTDRTRKTPAERATEELDRATRVADRLVVKRDRLRAELDDVDVELEVALRRRDYLAASPDLPGVMQAHTGPSAGMGAEVYTREEIAELVVDPIGLAQTT